MHRLHLFARFEAISAHNLDGARACGRAMPRRNHNCERPLPEHLRALVVVVLQRRLPPFLHVPRQKPREGRPQRRVEVSHDAIHERLGRPATLVDGSSSRAFRRRHLLRARGHHPWACALRPLTRSRRSRDCRRRRRLHRRRRRRALPPCALRPCRARACPRRGGGRSVSAKNTRLSSQPRGPRARPSTRRPSAPGTRRPRPRPPPRARGPAAPPVRVRVGQVGRKLDASADASAAFPAAHPCGCGCSAFAVRAPEL
mmetsp:Transcript_17152/g.56142  ORF Transcript_17152/g.56142 Transcript_17152/m.56142 type:complete len:257 (+) Transcript_17152:5607-6377(+)